MKLGLYLYVITNNLLDVQLDSAFANFQAFFCTYVYWQQYYICFLIVSYSFGITVLLPWSELKIDPPTTFFESVVQYQCHFLLKHLTESMVETIWAWVLFVGKFVIIHSNSFVTDLFCLSVSSFRSFENQCISRTLIISSHGLIGKVRSNVVYILYFVPDFGGLCLLIFIFPS